MTQRNQQESNVLLRAQLRLMLDEEIAFGPGKADLLDAIHDTGSISAARKKLGMSYRRAWMLVDVMNRCFNEPLVAAAKGGANGGGAQLTDFGKQVLKNYRKLQAEISALTHKHAAIFKPLMRKKPLSTEQ